jgi:hypothetical protein
MAYWLIKSEPNKYPFSALVTDKTTSWDGVRNFEARNNLRSMKRGDLALFYHSNIGKEFVGVARVTGEARPDPSAPGEDWSVVDFAPVQALTAPVTLAQVRAMPALAEMALLKRSRLSVAPVTASEWKVILAAARTKL